MMWGDELPAGPDPGSAVLSDAITLDDANGRASGLVVQGDALSLGALLALLESTGSRRERLALLPPVVRRRLDGYLRPTDPG